MCNANKNQLINEIKRFDVHDHICLIYETQEERLDSVIPFLKNGLTRKEKCIYITDNNTTSAILRVLEVEGIDADSVCKSGALEIVDWHTLYLEKEYFDPENVLNFLKESIEAAKSGRFSALRVAIEMTWIPGNIGDCRKVVEYESRFNHFFKNNDVLAICMYNLLHFSPEILADVIYTHHVILYGGNVCENFYYIPPDEFLGTGQGQYKLKRILHNILERKQVENQLKVLNESLEQHVIERTRELKEVNAKLQEKISEFKQAEERLRKLSTAVEQSPCTMLITDKNGIIEYVNPKFTQITGYSREEIIGKKPNILKSSKTLYEEYHGMWNTIMSGKEWYGEFCNKKKGGEFYWESTLISPIKNHEGTITHFVAVKEDITERKRIEETLTQSSRLQALGVMVAGIAHQFNNILTIISGNVQLLTDSYEDHENMMQRLRVIRQVAVDGAKIIHRMTEFTKINCDSSQFIPVNIGDLIKHAVDFSKPRWKDMAQASGISYKICIENIEELPLISGNPTELREVLINIINNALDAMSQGGTLSFRTWKDSGAVFVSITDTGVGMSDDIRLKVFDPFFTTKGVKGTGLGLSVAYSIIKRHGGKIKVESQMGKGSTFILEIPIIRQSNHITSNHLLEKMPVHKYHILIVDDEPEICDFLKSFLVKKEYVVTCTTNGTEAVLLITKCDFDLVLCDLCMPDISGWEILRSVKNSGKKTKFGLVTGWNNLLNTLSNTSSDVIPDFAIYKPIELPVLLKHVQDALSLKRDNTPDR